MHVWGPPLRPPVPIWGGLASRPWPTCPKQGQHSGSCGDLVSAARATSTSSCPLCPMPFASAILHSVMSQGVQARPCCTRFLQEIVQEQITRVLLERLIVNRPHPWGLLVTFIELIKNPRYNFWSHAFTHCAGEIERLFESVARSCMGPRTSDEDASLQHHQQAAPLPAAQG